MKIEIEVKNCSKCPHFEEKRLYTSDSFELAHDWFCKKANGKKIRGYVDWHEENKIPIPEWCSCKPKKDA